MLGSLRRSLQTEQARCVQLQADVSTLQRQLQDAKAAAAKGAGRCCGALQKVSRGDKLQRARIVGKQNERCCAGKCCALAEY